MSFLDSSTFLGRCDDFELASELIKLQGVIFDGYCTHEYGTIYYYGRSGVEQYQYIGSKSIDFTDFDDLVEKVRNLSMFNYVLLYKIHENKLYYVDFSLKYSVIGFNRSLSRNKKIDSILKDDK